MGTQRSIKSWTWAFFLIARFASATASSKGQLFVSALMQNYQSTLPLIHYELRITASEPNTNVSVSVGKLFTRSFILQKDITVSLDLPRNLEIIGTRRSDMVVKIKTSKDVTVLAFSQKLRTSDTTIVYPYRSLGTEYIIVTPELGPVDSVKEFLVSSIEPTTLSIRLTGAVTFERKTYKPNTTLKIMLKELEAVQLQSKDDLSGTQIISTRPVAVITGHSCTWKYTKCDHVNEQLLPVNSWGTKFIVQPLSLQSKGDLIYIVAHTATQVNYQQGKDTRTANLQGGQVLKIDNKNNPLKIESNKGIEVMFFSTGSMTRQGLAYDTFLMNIPSVTNYCKSYQIYGQRGFTNYALIVIKTSSTAALTFDKIPIQNLKWVPFIGTEYSYAEYKFGDSLTSHLVEHPSEPFGLMSVGVATLEAYGSQASCIEATTCTNMRCEKDHFCKMVDGTPRCLADSVSTCLTTGDPHYITLDGRMFDMQGTCTYTILKSCGINGQLPSFNVEAKNQNRGNKKVSFVTNVKVQAYGQNISINAMEYGRVWVNGVKSGLPVTLAEGKMYVYQCGRKAVVKLELGLTVHFDWVSQLLMALKDSYTESVCGLCGNKNKDPKDDFATPAGKQAANPEELGESWKVEDGDRHCRHDCNGKCNDCPPGHAKRKEAEGFCGLIAKATAGPFSACHAKIDPQAYLDNCVYDVCLNKGDKQAACQSLKGYADMCQSAGVKIADWRRAAGCPLDCGPNSQFKVCGTACPNTCEDDAAATKCIDPCVESCECNEGFMLTLGKCVPKSTCGCTYKGLPYVQNQVFWEDDKCERLCTCNSASKQVECRATQCKASEKCGTVNGVRGCYPVSYGTCSASGDPHYNTLDGLRFVYQGDCVYQFSALCNKTMDLVDFQVNVQNEHRGNKYVTFTRTAEFTIHGLVILISRQFPGTVMLNSQRVNLPYNTEDEKVTMYKAGSNVVVKTDNGITLTFDYQSRVTLKLPSTYAGFVCGLCGDFDGDKTNDLTLKNGAKAPNPTAFGDSWKTKDTPGCKGGAPPPTCPNLQHMKDSQRSSGMDCGLLLSKEGPFRNCHSKVDPEGYFEDCVYDSCFFTGRQATFCQTLASYVAACQAAGGQVESWRKETFCPMSCPRSSHYELCSTGCPITCSGIITPAGCDSTCKESCSCNDGFVLSGDQCVDISQCGCLYREKYYKKGEVFYPSGKCDTQCTCQEGGSVDCIPFTCGPNKECTLADGILKCIPVDFGTCAALGDSHYATLDGHRYDYQGRCVYTLATSCGGNKNLTQFEVKVKQNEYGKMQATVTPVVTLEVYNHSFGMIQSKKGIILVDGVIHRLPLSLMDGRVRAFQHGMNVRIETDFLLVLQHDCQYYVKVTVPGSYKGEMCGLCGNYNGDTTDEFTLPDGQLTTDVIAFGAAWAVQAEEPCDPVTCGAPDNPCFTCGEDKKAVFRNKEYCGFLTDVAGPLSGCYSTIKPGAYFENCVYDLCAGNGDRMRLCHNIQSYVADCQAAGVTIRPWRSDSFCPMDCPANSSSSTCSNICASSCFGLVDSWDCPEDCVEGWECDGNLLFDGQQCVPMDKCGCYVDGRYYPLDLVILVDDCSKSCTCTPLGGLICEDHSCADDEKCTNEDGVIKCINKDPCKSQKCRAKEDCKLVDGKAQCFPQFTGTCWGWGDPHLGTYDGKTYSFQGTCSYILSEYCGNDTTLVPFRVVVKNDVRGGVQSVSYVAEIHTYIYGIHVTMKKADYPKIRVNDVLYNLPYEEAGLLKVYQSGLQVLLKAGNGLEMSYDWIWHCVLTIPSSYFGATCGLCGNFNQDAEDDMFDPSRNQVTDIVAWAGSWKVYDRDPFCWDYCSGDCPTCEESMKSLYSGNQYCGLIINSTDGPFRGCHSKVNPDKFFDDCLYDVCMNGGAKQILCQALSAYASTCRNNNVTVYDWRMPSGCPLPCPPNSHYEASGNACPATCLDRTAPDRCTDPPVETCQCDQGFVLSCVECVTIDNCGCSSNGVYYKPNEEFWGDKNCERRCRCDPALGMVVCQTVRCKDSERCMVANGVRGCFPVSYAECSARGDLHYYTYDGRRFDFMGTCAYLLVGTTSKDPALTPFRVIVKNDHRGIKAVSFTNEVTLELYGSEITLSKDYPGKILVNRTVTCLPFYFKDLQAFRCGYKVVIKTAFGMKLKFDRDFEVSVTIPNTYANAVSGLCGNNNGNADDELTMKDGTPASNEKEFGDSWKVADVPGCEAECNEKCTSCTEEQMQTYLTEEYCGILTKPDGPFSQCYETITPTNYFKDCVFDSCQNQGHQSTTCSAIRAYVTACQAKGVMVKEWRTDHFCYHKCPEKSHYELCGSGCPGTCYGLAPPTGCDEPCTEGCFCDSGYLLSGDKCVPIADCGCTYRGRYYQKGDDFFPDASCQERCRCTDSGDAECVKTSCGTNEDCKVMDGVQGCHPSGFGVCVAVGLGHYISFDYLDFDYQGTCTYTLATICSTNPGHRFSVVVDNVADAKKIMVSVDHHNITLHLGSRWTAMINEEVYNLPVVLDGGLVMINQEGNNMVVRTGAGEEVLYDGAHYVQVKVPTTYKEKMCGLCGNFNDDPSDDFLLPNGKTSRNVNEFCAAWKLPVKDSECTDGCGSKCPVCSEERTAPYTANNKCGMITATEGPFQNCHTLVDPSNYFNYCLYDMCVLSNDQEALCSSLQAYTAACQDAGAEIHAWRETASCPFTCPANSHYELCTYTCDYTCPALLEQTHCTGRCYEGCESDGGHVFDGSLCVPRNSCGCMYHGRYLQLGMTILVNGCTKSCNCGPGGRVVCVDYSCANNEKCLSEDGVVKCVNTATCKYTHCEKNYICVMADGKPKCVPDTVVVCQVYGDPHYNTYDGHKYKMQGTCTYTVVKSCEANGQLPRFSVEAKNRNRGNRRVSYVDMINMKAYGQNVTIYAMEQGHVRVNGIKSGLPITLAGGQIYIYNGGGYAVVELKYFLKVYFDWEGYLRVDLKSSYTGRVCGLCGNNNKDPNDDFVTPEGTQAASIEEFVKSWKVEDGDLSCWHDCSGPCKACPPNLSETYKSESFCGLIAKATDGPFSQCHSKIDPQSYLDNCIYDVCLNNGAKRAACQSLKVYADTCQKAGVAIADWRKAAQCPLECGPNSQYKLCGTACPNTCEDDTASTTCMDPCVESCECKEGFVLTVGKCVPKNTCGCTYKGLPYIQNQVFWEDDKCERLCTCNPNTKQVECRAAQCKDLEKCGIVNGVRGCYPVGYGTCSSFGDPHYNTLDGVRFVYQGDCVYQFSALCNKTVDLVDFQVNVQNEHRGSKHVTSIRTVEFTIYGLATIISRQFPGTVMLNSHRINLPYNTDDGKVRIYKAGSNVVIKTDIGITLTFDFQSRITLKLPSTYAGFVCGLCGDFEGDKTNDLTLKNGAKAPNPTAFGDSWKTRDIPGCKESTPTPTCPNLQDMKDGQRSSGTDCGVLLRAEGPFRNCHRKVDPEDYFEDCVYDSCFYSGRQATFCLTLASYAVACQEAGGQVESWRTKTFCPMACPKNSHYELCSTGCPITCSGLTTPAGCDSTCTEGCSCNDGFVLSGDQCVDISQCGCLYREKYYKKGEVFYPSGKCDTQCTCQEGGSVDCIPFTCGPNEECTLADGILKCIPVDFGTCAALGDSHYTTLDGHRYDYQGRCVYTLATSCGGNKNLTQFEVKVKHKEYGKMQATVKSVVTLEVYNHSFGMIQSKKDFILVDGVIHRLPVSLMDGRVRAFQNGVIVRIETSFLLVLQYDGRYYVKVTVPGSYKGEMCGLCGNYNGDTTDEFTLPDGQLTTDVNAFGAAWAVQAEEPCDPVTCGAPDNPCFTCSEEKKAVFRNKEYCGFLTDVAGPLSDCHSTIKPGAYFENCVYDLCAGNGDRMRLCHNIQSYVSDCQAARVTIRPWRSDSFCPMECPANSSSSTCSNICASSCFALLDPWDCPKDCVEGWECDGDLLFDGQQCVPMDKCGCYVDGRYYPQGVVILADDCSKSCTCSPLGGLVCEAHGCADDEKCTNEDGVIKCINKDPCKSKKCRAKEDCKLVDGKAQCFPQFTGTCWGWGDPHLCTYDGKTYSFQGTCSYILSEYCGNDTTLVPFRVVVKNDVRGGVQSVSYVSEIHTYIYGNYITMKKAEYLKIGVNGILYNLPYEEAGLFKVYQSGLQVLLKAGNGLAVSFDWIWHIVISLPSSYYGATCGLCGDFNQNTEDDMFDPSRNQVTDIVAWAGSWKVYDRDPFCWDYCSGDCPTCEESMKSLYSGNQYCGLIINSTDGPFRECHSKVNPDRFFDDCLYDVCMNGGAKQILCQALSAYASTCLKSSVTLYDWRMPSRCPLPCQQNSHYEASGNACPATCLDRTSPDRCTDPPVETCQCDQGFVLSSGECVAIDNCGCSSNGVYYKPNEEFWGDKNCERRCRCDPALGMVVCQTVRCKDSERCMVANGVRGCFPVSYAECSARGNLHYYTYDGRRFDFMGTCAYLLVGTTSKDPALTPFRVIVKNDHRGIQAVSFTKEVTLELYGSEITLSKDYPGKILVNGTEICLPFYFGDLQAFRCGDKVVIKTAFGMRLKSDWGSEVSVTIPKTYANAVSGLCGNNNGNADDDLTMKDGNSTSNEEEFGDSWKVADVPGCEEKCNDKCPTCSEEQKQTYTTEEYCGVLTKPDGPFSQCYETIDPTNYYKDCVFDSCQTQGQQSTVCGAIRAYVTACQAKGAVVKEWRTDHFCHLKCPGKRHYELCGRGCPGTCYGLAPPTGCDEPCTEGCFCDSGFLLSGDTCVPIADCGCTYKGRYYKKGEDFYPDTTCEERCRCTDSGSTECVKTSCGVNEKCKVVNGIQGCHPSGFGICVAAGHRHYLSFDNRAIDYQGTCTYTLAAICSGQHGHRLSVVVGNGRHEKNNVAQAKMVMVSLDHHNITMERGMKWMVKINQERYNLPVTLDGGFAMINQEGNNIVVRTGAGEEVLYDGEHYVHVKVPTTYKEKMCGLCGNFNGDPSDDFLLPNGKPSTNVNEFCAAWKLPVKDSECSDGCGSKCPVCSKERTAPYTADTKCGMITATEGPFQNCHKFVDPTSYFSHCLYDMCVLNNDQQALCSSLQAYTAACQDAGAEVHVWRETASCPLTCPASSHYELCTHTCEHTCAALLQSPSCTRRCYEGCECDAWHAFDGSRCVPRKACGCVYNSRYIKVNESIVMPMCTQRCSCGIDGVAVCAPLTCGPNEVCEYRGNVLGCYRAHANCTINMGLDFISFDNQGGKMPSPGSFDFAFVCDGNSKDWFRVVVDLQPCSMKSTNAVVFVFFWNTFFSVNDNRQFWLNGRPLPVPIRVNGVINVFRREQHLILEVSGKVQISIGPNADVRVQVWDTYAGKLCGACGNFNDNSDDDLQLSVGGQASDASQMITSWRAPDFSPCIK